MASSASPRKHLLEGRPAVLLMELIEGGPLLPEGEAAALALARVEVPGIAEQLGRIAAVDAVLNNWDRLPMGVPAWRAHGQETVRVPPYPGNLDNVFIRESDGVVFAIDTDMKREYPANRFPAAWGLGAEEPPQTTDNDFLAQLAVCFDGVRAHSMTGGIAPLAMDVRDGLSRLRVGVQLSDGALRAFQRGMVEAMDRLDAAPIERLHSSSVRAAGLGEEGRSAALVQRARRVLAVWREHNPHAPAPSGATAMGGAMAFCSQRSEASGDGPAGCAVAEVGQPTPRTPRLMTDEAGLTFEVLRADEAEFLYEEVRRSPSPSSSAQRSPSSPPSVRKSPSPSPSAPPRTPPSPSPSAQHLHPLT